MSPPACASAKSPKYSPQSAHRKMRNHLGPMRMHMSGMQHIFIISLMHAANESLGKFKHGQWKYGT